MKYKDTWLKFWILKPINKRLNNLGNKIVNYFHEKFNYWYCQDCHKYHSGRIENFNTYDDCKDGFCQKKSADEALKEVNKINKEVALRFREFKNY